MFQWFSKKLNQKRKGFTLIELVVVIAILGLLAALAIPRFTDSRTKAAKTTVLADARSIYSELEVTFAEEGKYPDSFTPLGSYTGTITYTVVSGNAGYDVNYVNAEETWEIDFDETGIGDLETEVTAYVAP